MLELLFAYTLNFSNTERFEQKDLTRKLAIFLERKGLDAACIDLKRDYRRPGLINLLVNRRLEESNFYEIHAELCPDKQCALDVTVATSSVDDLQFAYLWSKRPWLDENPTDWRLVEIAPSAAPFPRVSSSCMDGDTGASYFFTARSHESRALLESSGVPLENVFLFQLETKAGEFFWRFGKPDMNWTGHPHTRDDQPLVPSDLLEHL